MRSYVRWGGGICGREVEGESKESERKPLGSRDVIGEAVKLLYPDMFILWHQCRWSSSSYYHYQPPHSLSLMGATW